MSSKSPSVSSFQDWNKLSASQPEVMNIIQESILQGDVCTVDLSQVNPESDLIQEASASDLKTESTNRHQMK